MFILIQNDPECPPGRCATLLQALGHPFRTIAAYCDDPFPPLSDVTGIIVLGGEMGVHDTGRYPYLLRVGSYIKEAVQDDVPLLGICLGGQLLAHVAGGEVASPSPHREKGVHRVELNALGIDDPLFAGVPESFVTFQLHNDSFSIPADAVLLASSARCPSQSFRLGSAVYGVQFHPEVDRAIVSSWGNLFSPPRDFLSGFLAEEPLFQSASDAILGNFIALALTSRRP